MYFGHEKIVENTRAIRTFSVVKPIFPCYTVLWRYEGKPMGYQNTFSDAMQWTVGEGIINGSDGKLLPQGSATRAQVATILMRYIEKTAR